MLQLFQALVQRIDDQAQTSPNNSYFNGSPSSPYSDEGGFPAQYQPSDAINSSFNNYGLSAYGGNPTLASFMTNQLRIGNMPTSNGKSTAGGGLQAPYVDPMYLLHMRTPEYVAGQLGAFNDLAADRNYLGNCNEWSQIIVPSLSSNRGSFVNNETETPC
ncbi:hypothetical protein KIW84_062421 [Lathyrus oleraceus]|uniref:Nucleic acid binding NABP domain-containing protein n=1 Tax=Pisum sativum TaxID=3888 RepID=A0A9D4W6V1_PEA|nr:hypothetical protein KIW84_062421 [Pisum sativum]